MPSVYLECVDGISSKFWQCSIKGCDVTSTYGKIGGAPSSTTKSFPTAEKAQAFYDKEANSKMNKGYQMKGKKVKAAPAKASKGPLAGKVLCFTGALSVTRSSAKKFAVAAGATVTGSVSHNTDILVVGKDAGSKTLGEHQKIVKGSGKMQYWAQSSEDEKKFMKKVGL
ncbi:unnamed protein product [Effrenium voratum]|nr:unnamed protein product [Effrenium voratum]